MEIVPCANRASFCRTKSFVHKFSDRFETSHELLVHEIRMNVGIVRSPVLSVYILNLSISNNCFKFEKGNANTKYRSYMTRHGVVEIDAEGWGTFTCFSNDVQVWVKAAAEDNLN